MNITVLDPFDDESPLADLQAIVDSDPG